MLAAPNDQADQLLSRVVRGTMAQCRAKHCEHGEFVLNMLRHSQPMKTDQGIGNVVGAFQLIDEPCCRIQHRLQTAHCAVFS